jgi:hypothetical protein
MRGKKLPRSKNKRTPRTDMRLSFCQPPYNNKVLEEGGERTGERGCIALIRQ